MPENFKYRKNFVIFRNILFILTTVPYRSFLFEVAKNSASDRERTGTVYIRMPQTPEFTITALIQLDRIQLTVKFMVPILASAIFVLLFKSEIILLYHIMR
jgi:hypothetical protein